MDVSNWKRILLHWINQLGFLDRTFYNIEQTDIERFFKKFRGQMKNAVINEDIKKFLKDEYPDFEPNLDDENALSSADYMYVYSLLLHFSCVKCPEEYFHKLCQSLPEQFQNSIALLFKRLVERDILTKSVLRHAIATITLALPLPKIQSPRFESPQRTPRSDKKFSPITPKTEIIEEKTRELHLLRAQLDTERYEKGFLEVQLKQNNEKITKLVKEHKKHLMEISELKNNLLVKKSDNCVPTKNIGDDQVKKRLQKNIAQKEEEVINLNEKLTILQEEKSLLQHKLTYSNEQVFACLDKIKEFDCKIEDLSKDLEEKDLTIKYLTETKIELEQYINETRSLYSPRSDNNVSIECLDSSFSRTPNSSESIGSPENLGVSVIDIHLREKEYENNILREELKAIQLSDSKLSKHIYDIIVQNSETFNICNENFIATEEDELTKIFLVFENYFNKLIENYHYSRKEIMDLQNETISLTNQKLNLVKEVNALEDMVENFRSKVVSLESSHNSVALEKDILENQLSEFQCSIKDFKFDIESLEKINCQRADIIAKLESNLKLADKKQSDLNNELILVRNCNSNLIKQLEVQEESLQQCNEKYIKSKISNEEYINKVQIEFEEKEELLKGINNQLSESKVNISELKLNLANLSDEYEAKNNDLKDYIEELSKKLVEQEQLLVKQYEYESSNIELNRIKTDLENHIAEQERELDELRSSNKKLKATNQRIISEYDAVKSKNDKLKVDVDCNAVNFSELRSSINTELIALKEKLLISNEEIATLTSNKNDLEESLKYYQEETKKLQSEKVEMSKTLEALQNKIEEITEDHQLQLNELNSSNQEMNKTITVYQGQLGEYACQKADFGTYLKESEKNLRELTEYHKLKLDEMNTLKTTSDETIKKLSDELKCLNLKLYHYQSDIDKIDEIRLSCKNEKESILSKLTEKENKLQEFNEKFQNAFEENTQLIKTFNVEKADLSEKLTRTQNEMSLIKTQLNEKSENFENLVKYVIDQLENHSDLSENTHCNESFLQANVKSDDPIDILKIKLNSIFSYTNYLKEDNKNKISKINILSESLNNFKSHLDKSQKEILNIRESFSTESKIMQGKFLADIARLTENNKNLYETTERLNKDNCGLIESLCELKQQLVTLSLCSEKVVILEKQNQDLLLQLDNFKEETSSLLEQVKCLENEKNDLINKNDSLVAAQKDNHCRMEDLKIDLQKSTEACKMVMDDLKIAIELKEQKLQALIQDKENDTAQVLKLLEENEALQKTINEKSKELDNKNDELTRSQEQYYNLVEGFETMNKENAQLKFDNSLKTEKYESNATELELTRKEFEKLSMLLIQIQHEHSHSTKFSEIQMLTEKLTSNKYYYEKKEKEFQQQLAAIEAEKVELKKSVDALLVEKSDFESFIKSQNDEYKIKSERVSELEIELVMLQEDLQAYEDKTDLYDEDTKVKEQVITELKANLEAKSIECQQLHEDLAIRIKNYDSEVHQLKDHLTKCEQNVEHEIAKRNEDQKLLQRYESDNTKFIESMDSVNDRLERQSIKLGESQAIIANLEKENELKNACIAEYKTNLESTRQQFTSLSDEYKQFKDRKMKIDLKYEMLVVKYTNLEKTMKELEVDLYKSEDVETKLKNTLKTLIAEKDHLELRIDRLNITLTEANQVIETIKRENETLEQRNVELNLEIGGLNLIVSDLKSNNDSELMDIKESRNELKELNETYRDNIELLNNDIDILKEDNILLNEDIEKMAIRYQRIEEERDQLQDEIKQLKNSIETIIDRNHKDEELMEIHQNQTQLLNQIEILEDDVQNKTKLIESLNRQIETLNAAAALINPEEISELKTKLEATELSLKKEIENSTKLKLDISIYHAKLCKNRQLLEEKEQKWSEEKQQLLQLSQNADERIKDNRLELEGKLEKMKSKMDGIAISFDDSLSSLLNTGQRKKASGATSYKRPGPPTPSKNAGRLSFGGCIEMPREILKESHDSNVVSSTKRTPAKFKLFSSSKFTSFKDEPNSSQLSHVRRSVVHNRRHLDTELTSTPRKSKVHYDQRRQLDKFLLLHGNQSEHSDSESLTLSDSVSSSVENSNPANSPLNWREQKIVYTTESTSDSNSPLINRNLTLHKRKPKRDRRLSLYMKGNIYSKSKLPNRSGRDHLRNKAKDQRGTNFNVNRQSLNNCSIRLRKSSMFQNQLITSRMEFDFENEHEDDLEKSRRSDHFDFNDNILLNNSNSNIVSGLLHFEQLLNVKESQAPFEITEINFLSTSSQTNTTINSNSRTVYGQSVIFNQKIPNCNRTVVRKSSIYVNPRNGKPFILHHNSKITFSNMTFIWQQFTIATKIFFCILFGIPTITIFVLLLKLYKL